MCVGFTKNILNLCNTFFLSFVIQTERGAEALWEELYERHYRELSGYAQRMSGSPELGEDLVQDTFLRALQNPGVLEDLTPTKQRAWLYRTLKNLYFDRWRRGILEAAYLETLREEPQWDKGIQEIENALVLQALEPLDKAIFQLRFEEGCTAREIGEMLNLPPGTVRSRLSRCRKYLKENLE